MSKTIALIGNQNCGKTTLFNCLTGSNQYVGNWPGVTLDKSTGFISSRNIKVADLPGLYSLSPYSPEEIVSRDFLLSGDYDVIVNIVDATHLERSLSLTCELLSFKRPMVIAINMMDLARKENITINTSALSERFGVPVVAISAAHEEGLDDLFAAVEKAHVTSSTYYDEKLGSSVASVAAAVPDVEFEGGRNFIALSLLQHDKAYMAAYADNEKLLTEVNRQIMSLEKEFSTDVESLVAQERYAWIDGIIKDSVTKGEGRYNSLSKRIDDIVTNRFLAIPIFVFIVYIVYYLAVSTIGTMGTDYANDVLFGEYATNAATSVMESVNAPEWLSGLVVDGIIGGVGAVLGFVPQMIVLFILLSLLEQSGYMTRVAFVLDRIFRHFGLSGRCFIPMVVASGCGVPAIMATNNIDNINEKRITIITTTFVPCSAKLPILAMIAAAFFPESTLVAPAVYFLAIFSIGFTAFILKKDSTFKEEVSPFVLEMPNYTLPKLRNVMRSTYERCRAFVIKAGTVIFATVVVVWFLSNFNFTADGFGMVEVNNSLLAVIGSAIAFIFIPLGFASWQASVAIFTGLLAKENVVGTLAVLLGLGEVAEDDASLGAALNGEFTTSAAAMSFLAFNLFSTPCIAALGAMKRQLNSPRLFTFAVVYMLVFSYCLAMIIYEIGGFVTGQVPFGPGTVVAGVLVLVALYLVFRPERKGTSLRIPVKQV
ncbi:ferrous iron transport protein B [Anaerobiospirillum sp. NML120449]|uniref:ferrous iron transport protein B n=1 Tax=Anaerobiospirillum sp. NML120449 TaxID=2932817 RepID=UPI001FF29C70|nr:ferrous iron transport protein B [Anaerobiospirillum sp. NML120449]MCK0527328.1 ferrous iron transport protein B [Anaerobiospirillum sp. NML120449]